MADKNISLTNLQGKITQQSKARSVNRLVRETMADLGIEGRNFTSEVATALETGDVKEAQRIGREAAKLRTLNQLHDMYPKHFTKPPSDPRKQLPTGAEREVQTLLRGIAPEAEA